VKVASAELMVNHYMAMDPGDSARQIEGIKTREPAFDLPAVWIPEDRKEDAKLAGYTVVDSVTIMTTHLTEIIRKHASELLGRQDVQSLLDNLASRYPKVVEELVPNLMSLGGVQKVLQNLLQENVSVKDLLTIVETLADYAPMTKDPDLLTEYVRHKLSRSIMAENRPRGLPGAESPDIGTHHPVRAETGGKGPDQQHPAHCHDLTGHPPPFQETDRKLCAVGHGDVPERAAQ
jgi:flagellar biosynthesis protein FlhA